MAERVSPSSGAARHLLPVMDSPLTGLTKWGGWRRRIAATMTCGRGRGEMENHGGWFGREVGD